jgi:ABC-type lipoprotein export system ATPase subunit
VITVTDLFCLYPVPGGATVAALRGMSLRVPAGERLVVHGPNGSGKTTLLRVLTGEVPASSGSVSVGGVELVGAGGTRVAELRRHVLGLVDQHSGRTLRPELDVLDNVALQLRLAGTPKPAAQETAREALTALGLSDLAARRPATLSAGEAQRVAVCAAVAHRPSVLLADEPTGELDVGSADAVYDLLAAAAENASATLLLVTHDPRAARVADRVVRIRDGRLSEQWHPDAPQEEDLVVDDRGWVRLPEQLRRRTGLAERARVAEQDGAVVLRAETVTVPPITDPPVLPGPLNVPDGPLAQLDGIAVRFGDRVLFDGLRAAIKPGSVTIVRGRSGAGKSTLLRMMLGLADPDAGDALLAGQVLRPLRRAERADLRRSTVGVSSQSGALAESLDTWENLSLARSARGLPADRPAVEAVVTGLGLAAVAHRAVRLLSGGERQRVAIARSLVVQRPLVVLDEPTSQQDEAHAELVTTVLIAAARAGTAIVCATHDPVLAAAADETLELV